MNKQEEINFGFGGIAFGLGVLASVFIAMAVSMLWGWDFGLVFGIGSGLSGLLGYAIYKGKE